MDVSKNTRPTVTLVISYREAHVILKALRFLAEERFTGEPASVRADAERMAAELQGTL